MHDHPEQDETPVQKVFGELPDLSKGTARPITVFGNPVLHREVATVTAFDTGG